MERTTFKKPEYLSPEWHERRRRTADGEKKRVIFGASEIPALMGVSPFQTLQDLAVQKIAPLRKSDSNAATERGHILEPALIEHCRKTYNADVVLPDVMFRRDRIVATLDGLEYEEDRPYRVFEAKTTMAYSCDDPLPATFFWQGQAQLDATGADKVVFVCLDRFMRIGFWELLPDLSAIDQMREQAEKIGSKLDSGEFVSDKDTPFTQDQIELLFPKPEGEIELSAEILDMMEMWDALKGQRDFYAKEEQTIKDQLANLMRNAEYATVGGQRVLSFKRQTRKGGMDYDKYFEQYPEHLELAKEFVKKDSEFRVMRKLSTKSKD